MDKKKEKIERIERAKRLSSQAASRVRQLAIKRGASALAFEAGLSPQNIQHIIDNENANIGNVVLFGLLANVNDFDESYYLKGITNNKTITVHTDFEIENERLKKENDELRIKLDVANNLLEEIKKEKTILFNILGNSNSTSPLG